MDTITINKETATQIKSQVPDGRPEENPPPSGPGKPRPPSPFPEPLSLR